MTSDLCDIRIGWILAGAKAAWRGDVRYVQTTMPVDAVRQAITHPARAQAGENVQAALFRAKQEFVAYSVPSRTM